MEVLSCYGVGAAPGKLDQLARSHEQVWSGVPTIPGCQWGVAELRGLVVAPVTEKG